MAFTPKSKYDAQRACKDMTELALGQIEMQNLDFVFEKCKIGDDFHTK